MATVKEFAMTRIQNIAEELEDEAAELEQEIERLEQDKDSISEQLEFLYDRRYEIENSLSHEQWLRDISLQEDMI